MTIVNLEMNWFIQGCVWCYDCCNMKMKINISIKVEKTVYMFTEDMNNQHSSRSLFALVNVYNMCI